jgi:hypothetical protein
MPLHPPLDRNSDTDRNANSVLQGLAAEARRRAELQRRRPRIALEPSSWNRFEARLHRIFGNRHHELVQWVSQVASVDERVARHPDALRRAAWLIIHSEVEGRHPGGTNAFRLSTVKSQPPALARTIHDQLTTDDAGRAMGLASVRLGPVGPSTCPVGPATLRLLGQMLTVDEIADAIEEEAVARAAHVSPAPTWVPGAAGAGMAQHQPSGLHVAFGPGTHPGPGEHGPFGSVSSSSVMGVDDRFAGLGVGTRMYELGAKMIPGVRWDSGILKDGSLGVRNKLHAGDPYLWRNPDCPKCGSASGTSWRSMSQAQATAIH